MDRKMTVLVMAGLILAAGGGFLLGRGFKPAEAPAPAVVTRAPAQTQPEELRDVPGLPALYIEGREYEKNDMPLSNYFAEFSPEVVIDPETKKIRPEAAARIRQELVGKQMTWDGYVRKVETAPSGRLVLVLQLEPGDVTARTAMIKFSPVWKDELLSYRTGEHVRVVGLFDRVFTVFPSLNGMSVEIIPTSSNSAEG
jgi:hypothetical protein